MLDDKGQPWTWGRADRGQLGLPMTSDRPLPGDRDRPAQSRPVFKPRPIKDIPSGTNKTRRKTGEYVIRYGCLRGGRRFHPPTPTSHNHQ